MCTAFTLEQCWASTWLQDSFDRYWINEGRRRGWKERQRQKSKPNHILSLRGEGVTMQIRHILDLALCNEASMRIYYWWQNGSLGNEVSWRKSEQSDWNSLRQYIKKQRHYFTNKGPSSQGYGFSSRHVGCESWTIKKTEHQRINAFVLWCWRRHLRVPWTARRSNQSILKEISPEYSLEGLMLKLKLQYLMQRADSFEKTLMLGKIEGGRKRG